MQIRPAEAADLGPIKALAVDTGLFEPDEVQVFDEMLAGSLDGTNPGHTWLVLDEDDRSTSGAAYYAPEPSSDRVWNLYFLVVRR